MLYHRIRSGFHFPQSQPAAFSGAPEGWLSTLQGPESGKLSGDANFGNPNIFKRLFSFGDASERWPESLFLTFCVIF